METISELLKWTARVAALIASGISIICALVLLTHFYYGNMVWGIVEESIPITNSNDYSVNSRRVTVVYTVDDGEYTGTYRSTVTTSYFCKEGESILLAANHDYSRVTPYTKTVDKINSYHEYAKDALWVSAIAIVISIVTLFICWLYDNRGCSYGSSESPYVETGSLEAYVDDVKRVARKCKHEAYSKMLQDVVESMQSKIRELHYEESVASGDALTIVRQKRNSLQETFKQIATMASTTAIQISRNDSNDELNKSVLKLKYYLDMETNKTSM